MFHIKKQINMQSTYVVILITLISIITAILLHLPIYLGLLTGLLTASFFSIINGYSIKDVFKMFFSGIKNVYTVLIMLSLIGMLISIWMASGTIPSMIYYGFKYLSNTNIILAAFLTCSIISMILGTALGTISTVGSAFLSLSIGLNIPLPLLVGAVVSGAYLGDRTSPMSSSLNLTATMTETNVIDNIKHMQYTTIPVFISTFLIYWYLGNKFINTNTNGIKHFQNLFISTFNIGFISLVPPALILICAVIFKMSIVKSIFIGLLSSVFISLYINNLTLTNLLKIAVYGYYPLNKEISKIMSGSGFISMINVLLVIIFSTGLNGILEDTKMIKPLIEKISYSIKNFKDLIYKTALLSFIISVITCNQTLSSIIPGQYLKQIYDKFEIPKSTLARTISDSGIITVPLIPWNVNAILVSSIMKISAIKYIPFAFFCYLLPLFTLIYPNFRNIKSKN
ncbi:Na+/H+ antiporter NhaC family protein [Caminicella sporogenes]|nr:Na+/H+ antiporter NhaC family protein [Caminicella sporogenes]